MDKNSLAFILTPLAATPTHAHGHAACCTGRRLPSARHRAAQAFFPSDSLRHSLTRPLTAYLRHASSDAPRIDRVRLRPLQADGRGVLSARSAPPMPSRDDDATAAQCSLYEHRPVTVIKREPKLGDRPMPAIKREPIHEDATQNPVRKSSKFCMVEGCSSRAKHARRCWKHGGSVKCKVPDCVNRAKSKGVCWSHGGGSPCSVEDCDTIAVSNGFCWAHGGGKRCRERGCSRPAYERTRNYCVAHFEDLEHAAAALL